MSKEYTWKGILVPNHLTKDVDNDSTLEVSTVGNTRHNADIAKAIKQEGSDLQIETIEDVLDRADRWKLRYILNGSSVQDGNMRISPRVSGSWIGVSPKFDPAKHHITVDATPTATLRKGLEKVGIDVVGRKTDGGAVISLVTDVLTGNTDGLISCGGDIIIEGSKIKIDPVDGPGLGVFFTDPEGRVFPLDFPITENSPSKIVCRVPARVDMNFFELKIVTRCSSGGGVLLKTPRTIVYEKQLFTAVVPE
jgi:hypothetical protein